jgi:hypothetical protein
MRFPGLTPKDWEFSTKKQDWKLKSVAYKMCPSYHITQVVVALVWSKATAAFFTIIPLMSSQVTHNEHSVQPWTPAMHVDYPVETLTLPVMQVENPRKNNDLLAVQVDYPRRNNDLLAVHVEYPGGNNDPLAKHVDNPCGNSDPLAITLRTPTGTVTPRSCRLSSPAKMHFSRATRWKTCKEDRKASSTSFTRK